MTGSAQAPKNQQLGAEVVDQIKNSQTALEASLRELKEIVRTSEESQRTRLAEIQSKVGNLERLSSDLDRKLQAVDGVVRKIQDDVEGRDYKEILGNLHLAMRESHSNLLQTLPESVDHSTSILPT